MPKYPKVNYIGNKEKLASWIISELPLKKGKVLDLFAGGCSVSYALKLAGYEVLTNDVLYVNYILGKALIENQNVKLKYSVLKKSIPYTLIQETYKDIDFLVDTLFYQNEVKELSELIAIASTLSGFERYLFLSLIRRAMIRKLPYSRMNVPWEQIKLLRNEEYSYEKYGRKRAYHNSSFEKHIIDNFDEYNNAIFEGKTCKAYNFDAKEMIDNIDNVDMVYIDPPYPSTMNKYDDFYGNFDRMFKKSITHVDFTDKNRFLINLEELIILLHNKTRYIILSLNTKVNPSPILIKNMLKKYGQVKVRRKEHNYKVTRKENKNGSEELLFILKLKQQEAILKK